MTDDKKISEETMLDRLWPGTDLLWPLTVRKCELHPLTPGGRQRVDARIVLARRDTDETFSFVVEAKSRATPQYLQSAVIQARKATEGSSDLPMIMLPYLSTDQLKDLESQSVSGVDMCGNGVVIVPDRLYVSRTGQPNLYPDSRPLSNPYRGRSAMVARMLLSRPRWESLNALAAAIKDAGVEVSLAQVSKAVRALTEELIVLRADGAIFLREPLRLLDRLGAEWRTPEPCARQSVRLPNGYHWPSQLAKEPAFRWTLTGDTSVDRYTTFAQSGPRRAVVENIPRAISLLGAKPEPTPNFADLELVESDEPGYFFGNEIDHGVRWASRLQTWLELQSGDARQQEAARDLRERILKPVSQ